MPTGERPLLIRIPPHLRRPDLIRRLPQNVRTARAPTTYLVTDSESFEMDSGTSSNTLARAAARVAG